MNFFVPNTQEPESISAAERKTYFDRIKKLLQQEDAVIVAHYYVGADIQALAEESGGIIGDSLAMACFGYEHPAQTLVVAGVKFMGETAKILNPEKRVLMPTLEATCSLDLGCPADEFATFCQQHPDRTVVVYANTSADVKALSDWVVTSSNALEIVDHLDAKGEKIIWAPDRYLGSYIQKQTNADMLLWEGSCIVHEEFKSKSLMDLREQFPEAAVLVHPESPPGVIAQADVVGSTRQLINAVQKLSSDKFIVATDRGIFYKMRQLEPDKTFLEAPTAGHGATCRSCAHCPWMAMNSLSKVEQILQNLNNDIKLPRATLDRALIPVKRMVDFARF